jgi:hypothetical protein
MLVFRKVNAQESASKVIVKAIRYYMAKKKYYLFKMGKNPSIKVKSTFLLGVKDKKTWETYMDSDL